ncbi:MAG: c-type cytochrome, partial [Terriglobia bacterium]
CRAALLPLPDGYHGRRLVTLKAGIMFKQTIFAALALFAAAAISAAAGRPRPSAAQPAVPLRVPPSSSIPKGPKGDLIRLGKNIMMNTPKYAASYVGNNMKCSDCHIDGGTVAYASPLAGVTTLFPWYSPRAKRVITVQDRLNECFVRSENGKPLPDSSREMIAMIAYMNWLSQGIPMGSTVQGRGLPRLTAPAHVDMQAGARIYQQECSMCHGANGQGAPGMSPPLWGPHSINDGAGMSKAPKMAAFVKANMPPTKPGSLSVQQAFDVAAFVDSHPRPHYNPTYNRY